MSIFPKFARPLQPSEVPTSLHPFIDFQGQAIEPNSSNRTTCVSVTCPVCSKVRRLPAAVVRRKGSAYTALCQSCAAHVSHINPLSKDEVDLKFRDFIDFDNQYAKDKLLFVPATCPLCLKERLVAVTNLRFRKGRCYCHACSMILRAKGKVSHSAGYVMRTLSTLQGRDYELASLMRANSKSVDAKCYVREHRLIMALHLDRPLTDDEIVHHKNGVRDDNRLENLELLTVAEHPPAHGHPYYQQWQEAELKIKQLEAEIHNLKPCSTESS